MSLYSLIAGIVIAVIVKFALDFFGVPSPIDWLVALVVFLGIAFGWDRFGRVGGHF